MSFVLIRIRPHTGPMTTLTAQTIAIRPAVDEDHAAVRRLAALDSAPMPTGPLLLGVVDGEIRSAAPLTGGHVVADPFHATAEVVDLLRIRAARLRGDVEPTRAGPQAAVAAARRLRRATALRT